MGAENLPGNHIPTLHGFIIVDRCEPSPAMTFAVVKKNFKEIDGRVEGDMDVETFVRLESLSPKLQAEVKEYLQQVPSANPEDLHPDTRANVCPGWKEE